MLISKKLFKKIENVANSTLKYEEENSETKYTREIENLLRVRPIIYYRRSGRLASQIGWEEPKIWKMFAQSRNLSLTKIKKFKLLYGLHKSKKYGVGFIIPYENSINVKDINQEIKNLFKSHVKKQIKEQKFQLYNDETSKIIVILTICKTSNKKKENMTYAKSNYAKPSTV